MSNTKHTPGPWRIRETLSIDGDFVITTDTKMATSYHVAEVLNLNGYAENCANARLIAAAPDQHDELLKCRSLLLELEAEREDERVSMRIASINRVISKATTA